MLSQIVIFGASGDLTGRKLIPGLFANYRQEAFSTDIQVIGASRRDKADAQWRAELAQWIEPEDRQAFAEFAERIFYVATDATDPCSLGRLRDRLDTLAGQEEAGRLFYLALKPSLFGPTVRALDGLQMVDCEPGAQRGWRRVVVEKPFGKDLSQAVALNAELRQVLREDQILRIDHYLGKETVQNILAFRFQNAIFEPLWNREHIESVEISVCEQVTMEGGRGGYYDGSGAIRDMLQNHVLQVLALIAMDAPNAMNADEVRGQKVRVLQALTPFSAERVRRDVVRGQYVAAEGKPGYLEEAGVPADSQTETFVAVRANIQNWRWNGVPFLLRTGKALNKRYTDVTLRFRVPPVDLLGNTEFDAAVCALRPNALRLSIQPTEGIHLGFLVKRPGSGQIMQQATLGFDYDDLWSEETPPAYQRLLLDAIEGNRTLFIRGDEVEAAWRFVDAIRDGWNHEDPPPMHTYPVGSWGPDAAGDLFRGCEGTWGVGEDE